MYNNTSTTFASWEEPLKLPMAARINPARDRSPLKKSVAGIRIRVTRSAWLHLGDRVQIISCRDRKRPLRSKDIPSAFVRLLEACLVPAV